MGEMGFERAEMGGGLIRMGDIWNVRYKMGDGMEMGDGDVR